MASEKLPGAATSGPSAKIEDMPDAAKKKPARDYSPHLNPIHVNPAPSLLSRHITRPFAMSSSEARNQRREKEGRSTSKPLDITGFKHLVMLVLVTSNIKMLCSDWLQFGLRDTLENFGFGTQDLKMAVLLSLVNLLYMPAALAVERVAAWAALSQGLKDGTRSIVNLGSNLVHISLCLICLAGGSFLTWKYVEHPIIATGCEANVIVTFLKLVSFALTNNELRASRVAGQPVPGIYCALPYPMNLTLGNLVYFWAAPTLVYQPVYPMRREARWSRIMPLIGEVVTGMVVIWVLMMQVGMPVIEHLVRNFDSWQRFTEDYLTLATVNIMIWLTGFIILFQSTLNLMAEITRFADRNFYGDWWNAGSVGTFWRDWNRPISNYLRRHVYVPLRTIGVSRTVASNVVFLVSALLHELLFGVATHNFNGVAFLCMMVQPILIFATEPLEKMRGRGTTVGNCVMWVSILFGQPTGIVIYYLEWVARHPDSRSIPTRWWNRFFDDLAR